MELQKTNTSTQFIARNTQEVAANCISIAFYRESGTNPVFINGFPLPAGEMLSFNQSQGYIDDTEYEITFGTGGSANSLYVFRTIVKG